MVFVSCGLNHKTAPIALREKIAMPIERTEEFLADLTALPSVNEAAILSTCNRTEIYCDEGKSAQIIDWMAHKSGVSPQTLSPHFYTYQGHQSVRHVIRVASGLDSMMIGEPQILGQIKHAYHQACGAGTLHNKLRPIFDYIFKASKRVRTHSKIGANPTSIAFTAVQLISQIFTDFQNLNVFIIGSGETASLVAKYLQQKNVSQFTIANRSADNAELLASRLNGKAVSITDIAHHLPQADIIISATACPLPFITHSMIEQALAKRQNNPMFLLDLSVPRDIEASVENFEPVHLYNIDDLQNTVDKGYKERQNAAKFAEELINHEMEHFMNWHRSLKANDVICQYRDHMQALAQNELMRAQQKLSSGNCQQQVLDEFSKRLINKLTHLPTVGLRQAASDERIDVLDFAHYLFDPSTDTTS